MEPIIVGSLVFVGLMSVWTVGMIKFGGKTKRRYLMS